MQRIDAIVRVIRRACELRDVPAASNGDALRQAMLEHGLQREWYPLLLAAFLDVRTVYAWQEHMSVAHTTCAECWGDGCRACDWLGWFDA